MSPLPIHYGVLALELALIWVSFSPIFPLLTAPRREGHEELPSPVPGLLWTATATAAVAVAAASAVAVARRKRAGLEGPAGLALQGDRDGSAFAALFRGAVGLITGAVVIHAVTVVLGAPVLRHVPETAVFSVLVASLTSLPVSLSSRRPLEACAGFLRGTRPAVHESGAMVPAAGCALGAWLGAIPLCLDWERPWQAWPLPMCAGALLGFSLGCLLLLGLGLVESVRRNFPASWRGAEKRA